MRSRFVRHLAIPALALCLLCACGRKPSANGEGFEGNIVITNGGGATTPTPTPAPAACENVEITVTISGTVAAANGSAIAGASVADASGKPFTSSSGSGAYSLTYTTTGSFCQQTQFTATICASSGTFLSQCQSIGGTVGSQDIQLHLDFALVTQTTAVLSGKVYGPAPGDGVLTAFSQLDGVGGSGKLVVVADGSSSPSTPVGYGYLYNDGVTYPGSAQVTVPIRKGEYYEVQCQVPAGGWCSHYLASLTLADPVQSPFGARIAVSPGTVYGPATSDGFLSAFARLDGVGGSGMLIAVADGSSSPSIQAGYGYMYNNGVTYPGSAQVTVPIHKGQYFQIQCAVPAGGWCGDYLGYLVPTGNALGSGVGIAENTVYGPAPTDGFLTAFARLDGVPGSGLLVVAADMSAAPATTAGYGYLYNDGTSYRGSGQITVWIRKGEYFQIQCQVPAGGWCGDPNYAFTPVIDP